MSRSRLRHATRCTAAGLAFLAALPVLASSAQAGEVVTRNCLHGYGEGTGFRYSTDYGDAYSSDYGDRYGQGSSFTRPEGFGLRRGLADRHGRFAVGARDANGGGSLSGAGAGASNGSASGTSSGSAGGSTTGYGVESCIEVRHDLVDPYVIQVRPPKSDLEYRAVEDHDRRWTARCKPVIKQDSRGIERYVYAAPGCDSGRYE